MFKRPLRDLKTSAPLRSSERRKLRQRVLEQFSIDSSLPTTDALGDLLVPEGILTAKFSTHLDEHGIVYFGLAPESNPLWFVIGKDSSDSQVIPSVYTLWICPSLLPSVTTPPAVIPKLLGGADLMAPGVVTCPRDISKDELVSIREYGTRKAPSAVGYMLISSNSLSETTTGKAVGILHVSGDELWSLGSKKATPQLEDPPPVSQPETSDISCEGEGNKHTPESAKPLLAETNLDSSDGSSLKLTSEEVGNILRRSLIQAIVTAPPSVFPLSGSQFYSSYILPSRPSGNYSDTPIDIKHSPFKNLTQFLKSVAQSGLVKLKDQRGEVMVMSVDAAHPEVKGFSAHRTLADDAEKVAKREAREMEQVGVSSQIVVQEMWKGVGTRYLLQLFKELGRDPGKLYSFQELRVMVNEYTSSNSLASPSNQAMVRLDALLHAVLASANENLNEMKREEIVQRLTTKMQPWHIIRRGNEQSIKKGVLTPLSITTKQRQGKKIVTCVTGFEPFGIDPADLAEQLKIKCAGSTAVSALPGKQSALSEVMVQGNHVEVVRDVLEGKGINKKWISVEVAGKKK